MYELRWLPNVMSDMVALWRVTPDAERPALTWAIGDIDYRLSRRPEDEGESRPGNRRIAVSSPLVVMYEVDHQVRVVWIGHAWTHR